MALTLHLLGELLIDCNNFAEAEVDLQRALDLRQRKLSTESPLVPRPRPIRRHHHRRPNAGLQNGD